jgi:hypothetical protein
MTGSAATTLWLVSYLVLWGTVLFLGLLLLGALRALGILKWQLEQLQATTPRRLGRDGLRIGKKAPTFSLPGTNGKEIALADLRDVLCFPDRREGDHHLQRARRQQATSELRPLRRRQERGDKRKRILDRAGRRGVVHNFCFFRKGGR